MKRLSDAIACAAPTRRSPASAATYTFAVGVPADVLAARCRADRSAATAQGKTPLLVDVTTPAGENKNAGFSPLENFYSYSGNTLIELKKARPPAARLPPRPCGQSVAGRIVFGACPLLLLPLAAAAAACCCYCHLLLLLPLAAADVPPAAAAAACCC
jgi:hypothetical protein